MKRLIIGSLILFILFFAFSSISLAATCNCTGGACSGGIPCNAQGCTAACNPSPSPASVPKIQTAPSPPFQTEIVPMQLSTVEPITILNNFRSETFSIMMNQDIISSMFWVPQEISSSLFPNYPGGIIPIDWSDPQLFPGRALNIHHLGDGWNFEVVFPESPELSLGQPNATLDINGSNFFSYATGKLSDPDEGPGFDHLEIYDHVRIDRQNFRRSYDIFGGSGDDVIIGDLNGQDDLEFGDDVIRGGSGDDDIIRGGKEDDTINDRGEGKDKLMGGVVIQNPRAGDEVNMSADNDESEVEISGYDDFSIINYVLADTYSAIIHYDSDLIDSFLVNPSDFTQKYTTVIEPGIIYVDEEDDTLWYIDEDGYINYGDGEREIFEGPIPAITMQPILSFEYSNNPLTITEKLPDLWKIYGNPDIAGSEFLLDFNAFTDSEINSIETTLNDTDIKEIPNYEGDLWGVFMSQDILGEAKAATWKYNTYRYFLSDQEVNWGVVGEKPLINPTPIINWPTSVLNLPPLDPAPGTDSPLNITIEGKSLSTDGGPIYFFSSFGTTLDQENYYPTSPEVFQLNGENIVIDFNGITDDKKIEIENYFDSIGAKSAENLEGNISMFIAPSFTFDQPSEKNCLVFFLLLFISTGVSFMGAIFMFRLNSAAHNE